MSLRRWPWGRIVAGVLAAALLLVAIPFLQSSANLRRQADKARTTELVRMKVDLSKPNTYSAKFTHYIECAHGFQLELQTDKDLRSPEDVRAMLQGVHGRLTTTRLADGQSGDQDVDVSCFECRRIDDTHWVPVIPFHRSTEGDYEVRLSIDRGAQQLVGVPQVLVVRYEICGMEYLVAQFAWMIGAAGCLIAGILTFVIVVVTIVKRRKANRDVVA